MYNQVLVAHHIYVASQVCPWAFVVVVVVGGDGAGSGDVFLFLFFLPNRAWSATLSQLA